MALTLKITSANIIDGTFTVEDISTDTSEKTLALVVSKKNSEGVETAITPISSVWPNYIYPYTTDSLYTVLGSGTVFGDFAMSDFSDDFNNIDSENLIFEGEEFMDLYVQQMEEKALYEYVLVQRQYLNDRAHKHQIIKAENNYNFIFSVRELANFQFQAGKSLEAELLIEEIYKYHG